MPANLTADYLAPEQAFKRAHTQEERITAREQMLATLPKHSDGAGGGCAGTPGFRRAPEICEARPEIRRARWPDGGAHPPSRGRGHSGIPYGVMPIGGPTGVPPVHAPAMQASGARPQEP